MPKLRLSLQEISQTISPAVLLNLDEPVRLPGIFAISNYLPTSFSLDEQRIARWAAWKH